MPYKKKTFEEFINTIQETNIQPSFYYTNYQKVAKQLHDFEDLLARLGMVNSVEDFKNKISAEYKISKAVIQIIPLFTAVRGDELVVLSDDGKKVYKFDENNVSLDEALDFLGVVGFYDKLDKPLHLYSYYFGVEVGLDSNARKNRSGQQMAKVVGSYIKNLKNIDYDDECNIDAISKKWEIRISQENAKKKKFDFIIKVKNTIIFIETNFFNKSGSKTSINAAFENLQMRIKNLSISDNYKKMFILITDGAGLKKAMTEIKDVFNHIEFILNIDDLKNGALSEIVLDLETNV